MEHSTMEHSTMERGRTAPAGRGTAQALAAQMGPSRAVAEIVREVERVAPTDFSVVICGETGTGKELVARALHRASPRPADRFVAVDCGAIPATVMESELFGHEDGAFTGARGRREGRFEAADGGTLFLDEISNLPLDLQAKLLRVLQEKRFYRVGGNRPLRSDARILAATNRDLDPPGGDGDFRRDLYHRLAEYVIYLPPLRARREDVPYLADRFRRETARELGKEVGPLDDAAVEALRDWDWPGNVRELRNRVRRAVLRCEAGDAVTLAHLGEPAAARPRPVAVALGAASPGDPAPPSHPLPAVAPGGSEGPAPRLRPAAAEATAADWLPAVAPLPPPGEELESLPLKEIVSRNTEAVERAVLSRVLRHTGGNKAHAARILQIDYKTILTKVKQYGITIRRRDDEPQRRPEGTGRFDSHAPLDPGRLQPHPGTAG